MELAEDRNVLCWYYLDICQLIWKARGSQPHHLHTKPRPCQHTEDHHDETRLIDILNYTHSFVFLKLSTVIYIYIYKIKAS